MASVNKSINASATFKLYSLCYLYMVAIEYGHFCPFVHIIHSSGERIKCTLISLCVAWFVIKSIEHAVCWTTNMLLFSRLAAPSCTLYLLNRRSSARTSRISTATYGPLNSFHILFDFLRYQRSLTYIYKWLNVGCVGLGLGITICTQQHLHPYPYQTQ